MVAQEQTQVIKKDLPALMTHRAEEDYSYLKEERDQGVDLSFEESLKYIPLNARETVYSTIGGQYRIRSEHSINDNWTTEDDGYYSQRISLHASLHVGESVRFFGELYHGLTSNGQRVLQDDELDFHQLFAEWAPPLEGGHTLSLRLGRQELNLGASRLIGARDGPNMRRSFDLGRIIYTYQQGTVNLFFGQEVNPRFDAFNNVSNLINEVRANNPRVWGIYVDGPGPITNGALDVYYLGFEGVSSEFNDSFGNETRHSFGVRSSGNPRGTFSYNTELIAQFGTHNGNSIRALNVETDWKYFLKNLPGKPALGLKFDWSTGDKEDGDGVVHTFNPLFVNPAIYSLAGVNTPANLTSFHPSITVYPSQRIVLFFEYALFYRTNENDGFYAPPRFQTRKANGITDRHIGDVMGFRASWQVHRNISASLMSSYFLAGPFIKASGPSNNIFYVSPTIDFKF